jgi:hypothetical protein
MSLSTYADLLQSITNWLGGRPDLTAFYPDWIVAFEAAAARRLRVRPMEKIVLLTPVASQAALPADYLAVRRLTWTGNPRVDMNYLPPSMFQTYYPTLHSSNASVHSPQSYTIEGSTITISSTNTSPIELDYYAKNAAVSGALNWLWTNYPDAYLFGALAESGGFTRDNEATAVWKVRRDEVLDEIKMVDFRERPASMSVRVMGFTP